MAAPRAGFLFAVSASGRRIMLGPKILIVDDEKVFADTLAQIFRGEGYDCRAVYSAEQALDALSEQWIPDLTILDVMLPGMNGIDLAIGLKATHPSVAVMMISGQLATTGLIEQAAQKGHTFSILPKPFPVPDLLANASKLLARVPPATGPQNPRMLN
jgi:CheY-like chemotaxis protein